MRISIIKCSIVRIADRALLQGCDLPRVKRLDKGRYGCVNLVRHCGRKHGDKVRRGTVSPGVVVDSIAGRVHFAHDAGGRVIRHQRLTLLAFFETVPRKELVTRSDAVVHATRILADVVVDQIQLVIIESICACQLPGGQWQRAIDQRHRSRV